MGVMALDYDDEVTPIACRACGGRFKFTAESRMGGEYGVTYCRWCTRGVQSPAQFGKWQAHKSGLRVRVR